MHILPQRHADLLTSVLKWEYLFNAWQLRQYVGAFCPGLNDGSGSNHRQAGKGALVLGAEAHHLAAADGPSGTADADAVISKLKQSSLPAFREPAMINGRTAYRVRIGPYVERADAEAVRLKASQVRSDVKAQVVTLDATSTAPSAAPATASVAQAAAVVAPVTTKPLPPEAAKPAPVPAAVPKPAAAPTPVVTVATPVAPVVKPVEAPKPAASSVGFAVQLGAFSQASDANAMRDKLRAGGFSAFVEQVKTDKGTLNRVRVGPVASRADADRLKSQVSAKVGIDGMVRPHP